MLGYMTTKEAAKYLEYHPDYIGYLCSNGKLKGAEKIGDRMWLIPEQSVREYTPGLQGFAAEKARKEKKRRAELDEINAAIKFFGSQKLAIA